MTSGNPRGKHGWWPVDWIAFVLALGLALSVVLILAVSAFQVVFGHFPQVTISDNASQIITSVISALAGLLGAYFGRNRSGRKPPE